MSIHITFLGDPKGEQRGSSLIASLKKAKRQTDGEFKTTAADASGLAVFQDDKFKEISSKK